MVCLWTKYWVLFFCRGEGKQTQRGHDVKKSILSTYVPFLTSAWPNNLPEECGDALLNSLRSDIFFSSTIAHSSRQLTISLFDIFHRGERKQTQAETRIAEIRWICVMLRSSTAQDYATKGSRTALEFESAAKMFQIPKTSPNLSGLFLHSDSIISRKRWSLCLKSLLYVFLSQIFPPNNLEMIPASQHRKHILPPSCDIYPSREWAVGKSCCHLHSL